MENWKEYIDSIDLGSDSVEDNLDFEGRDLVKKYIGRLEDKLNNGEITRSQFEDFIEGSKEILLAHEGEIYQLESDMAEYKKEIIEEAINKREALLGEVQESQNEYIELRRLGKYFGINEVQIGNIQEKLDDYQKKSGLELGSLKLINFLGNYKDYIENNLNNTDPNIVSKIKTSIGIRTLQIGTVVENTIKNVEKSYTSDKHSFELKRERWNLNKSINDTFDFIDIRLLPTALLITKVEQGEIELPDKSSLYKSTKRGRRPIRGKENEKLLLQAYEEGKQMFNSELNDDGTFQRGFTSFFNENWNILNGLDDGSSTVLSKGGVNQVGTLETYGIDIIETPSILNEEDIQKEAIVMIRYMAFIGLMLVPYGGALASLPADLRDIFSSEEGISSTLQSYGLIPSDYKMDSEWYDSILGVVGIIGTAFGVGAATRGFKMAKAAKTLRRAGYTEDKINAALGKEKSKIMDLIFGGRINEPDQKQVGEAMRRAEARSGISREQVIENSRWLDEGRLDLPNNILEQNGLQRLTQEQLEVVKRVHTDISRGIYQNNNEDLMRMARELRKAGIDQQQTRVLMENGITGLDKVLNSGDGLINGFLRKTEEIVNNVFNSGRDNSRNITNVNTIETSRGVREFSIGDLHGDFRAFKDNIESLGIAIVRGDKFEWTGGNNKLVFVGDIMGDRSAESLRIMENISDLRRQARQEGETVQ